ncbi:MAG: hypothetical protein H0X33_00750 [Taibaiella sp.]|nr:hypothetical protein [Taibaiella sp.]
MKKQPYSSLSGSFTIDSVVQILPADSSYLVGIISTDHSNESLDAILVICLEDSFYVFPSKQGRFALKLSPGKHTISFSFGGQSYRINTMFRKQYCKYARIHIHDHLYY